MDVKPRNTAAAISFMRMLRIPNVLLIIAFFGLGEYFVLDPLRERLDVSASLDWIDRTLYVLDLLLITWFGYWLNDLNDRVADRINRPERPLSSHHFTATQVRTAAWAAFGLGLLLCVYLGFQYDRLAWVWIYPAVGVALWMYGQYSKPLGFTGNLLVSLLVAALPGILILPEWDHFKLLHITEPEIFDQLLWAAACYMTLVFLINLIREIVKDMEDEAGDREQGSRSLVILLGKSPTLRLIRLLLLGVVALQIYLHELAGTTGVSLAFSIAVMLLSLLVLYTLQRSTSRAHLSRASGVLKVIMLIGVFELILFRGLL